MWGNCQSPKARAIMTDKPVLSATEKEKREKKTHIKSSFGGGVIRKRVAVSFGTVA